MRLVVHRSDDALYLRLDDSAIAESEEVSKGITLDYKAGGKVIDIKVLHLSERSPNSLEEILLENA